MASMWSDKSQEGFISFKCPVTPARLEEVAREKLGETEERKADCLEKLKMLITKNGVTCIMRDDFLLRFLRYKKFNIEKSFEVVRKYVRMRVSIHERLMNLSPEVVKKCLDSNMLGFLPYRDHEERAIFFDIPENWNSDMLSFDEYIMCYVLMQCYIAEKPETQIIGFVSLYYDCSAPMSFLAYLVPHFNFIVNLLFYSQPARYSRTHIMNDSVLFKTVLRVIDPFLPKKVKDSIVFHGTTGKELSEHISPSILPNEFGGTLGPLSNDHIVQEVLSFLLKMQDEQRYFKEPEISETTAL